MIVRGVRKDNPEKAIVVFKTLEGFIGKHIQENIEIFKKNCAVIGTAEPSLLAENARCLDINKESNQKIVSIKSEQ